MLSPEVPSPLVSRKGCRQTDLALIQLRHKMLLLQAGAIILCSVSMPHCPRTALSLMLSPACPVRRPWSALPVGTPRTWQTRSTWLQRGCCSRT